jgi:hypothetical protein
MFDQLAQWLRLGLVLANVFLPFIAVLYHQPGDTIDKTA